MKVNVKINTEVELKTLLAKVDVRYWEDATVNGMDDELGDLIPCRDGDLWCPIIDINTGVITNWKQGVVAEIHYKVCDGGNYYLQDKSGNTVLKLEDNYVPSILCPKGEGYGDYIIMDVEENGQIVGFDNSDISDFTNDND